MCDAPSLNCLHTGFGCGKISTHCVHVNAIGVWPGMLKVLLQPLPERVGDLVKTNELPDSQHLGVVAGCSWVEPLDDSRHIPEDAGVHQGWRWKEGRKEAPSNINREFRYAVVPISWYDLPDTLQAVFYSLHSKQTPVGGMFDKNTASEELLKARKRQNWRNRGSSGSWCYITDEVLHLSKYRSMLSAH